MKRNVLENSCIHQKAESEFRAGKTPISEEFNRPNRNSIIVFTEIRKVLQPNTSGYPDDVSREREKDLIAISKSVRV